MLSQAAALGSLLRDDIRGVAAHVLFIHSSGDCFHFLAVVNIAAMNV